MLKTRLVNDKLYQKIKIMANRNRFRILELTQERAKSVSKLGKEINLSYTKCADYVTMLEKEKLVKKTKKGRKILVKSTVLIKDLRL